MRGLSLLAASIACLSLSGCYYGQLAEGQLTLMMRRQPIAEARVDPNHPEEVRRLLSLVSQVRDYAKVLGLEVDGQYTSYVDWPDDRIVTTLVRTRAGTLESVPWWFPVVGSLPYKGYFDREHAEAEAHSLEETGEYEVCVSGVSAYSTLGWLDDPVTRPMLLRGAASLVETVFHELVHATAFLPGDADFNEGVAQFIGQQAAVDFFATLEAESTESEWPTASRVRSAIEDRRRIAEATLRFRTHLEEFEGQDDREERRSEAERAAREKLAALPLSILDAERIAQSARLSDACLALRGTYLTDLPRHASVYAALDEDLPTMIERLRAIAESDADSASFFEIAEAPAADQSGER